MKKLNYGGFIVLVVALSVSLWGCSSSSTAPTTETEQASAQKQFVWNAMNFWYYWQSDVAELGDNYFNSDQEFQNYLIGFTSARALFENLVYEQSDDFSFFIEDYETYRQNRQGISESFGFEYGLVRIGNTNDIFGYVQYVLESSPAEDAGIIRGDIFTKVDGTQLNVNNYRNLLQGRTSYELSLAEIENSTISETGETVSLQAATLQENPVFLSTIIDSSSTRIGYLVYNAFQTNSHRDLNDVFGTFASEGVDELVLDLRYNSGGAGITSQTLAGMISGLDSTNVFSEYAYSAKRSDLNRTVPVLEEVPIYNDQGDQESTVPMNSLSLDRMYVLVDYGTASASEVLINGLEPYMEVVLIGGQTVGKDEGSFTLYDAPEPYLDRQQANPEHKIAIQPIVLKVVNVNGREYPNGFSPDYEVNELDFLEGGLPPLGSAEDPLLAKALELITDQQMAKAASDKYVGPYQREIMIDSRDLQPHSKGLYLETIAIE